MGKTPDQVPEDKLELYKKLIDAQPDIELKGGLKLVEGRTELTLTHSGIPNDMICDVIRGGWTASMKQLEPVVGELRGATDTAGARP